MKGESSRQLIQRAGQSGIWVIGGRLAQAGLAFASNVLLAHLLFPEAFGLMGMVSIFLLGLALFSDTGVGPSIVRSERGEDRTFLATAWTVQFLRGILLFALCWLLATPLARIYGEPELARLLPLAGLTAIFNGLWSTNWFLADRRLAQGRKVLITLLAQACGIVTMLIWAWQDRSVVALVAGSIAVSASQAVLTHLLLPGPRVYFRLERESVRELYGFGRWIFMSTALTFLAMQGDRMFLGYALKVGALLGVYFIAARIVELVTSLQGEVSASVVFPTWVESARLEPAAHASRVQRSRRALDSIGMAGLVGIATLAPALFRILYDDRYQEAAFLVQMLCLPAWFQIMKASATSAVLAYGDSRALSAANLLLLLVKLPACIGGYYLAGMPGIIVGAALGNCAGLAPLYLSLNGHGCPLLGQDLRASLKIAVLTGIGIFLPLLAARQDQIPLVIVEVFAAGCLGLIALSPARILLANLKR